MDPKKVKKQFAFKIKLNVWTIVTILAVIFFVAPLVIAGFQLSDSTNKLEVSQLVNDAKDQKIKKVLVEEEKLIVEYNDGTTKFSTKESNQSFTDLLEQSGVDPKTVNYTVVDQSLSKAFGDIAGIILPILI